MCNCIITELEELKTEELLELLTESTQEGFRHIARLVDDYTNGINRFSGENEALFEYRVNGKVVGICGLNQDPYLGTENGRVRRLYVLKEFRRCGIGRKLIEAVINRAAEHYQRLILKTDNLIAYEFYKALGFKEIKDDEKVTHCLELDNLRFE